METGNGNTNPQGEMVEVVITPEQYQKMTPAQREKIQPSKRAKLEAALTTSQNGGKVSLPDVVGGAPAAPAGTPTVPVNAGDKSTPVDPAKLEAERLAAERKAFEDLPRAERMKLRREAQEAHARRWFNVVEVDFRSSNDLSAMLAGAIIMGIVIGAGYIIVRLIKSE